MKKQWIEEMLDGVEDKYIAEAAGSGEQTASDGKRVTLKVRKYAVAAAVCVIILGTGISVGAASSSAFRNWIKKNFLGHEITKVDIVQEDKEEAADLPLDGDAHLSLKENMEIYGEKESFVCQYHKEGEDEDEKEVVDQVYSIQDNGLKKLELKHFQGKYDGVDFDFEYAIINQEILAFNYNGDISQVFHYMDGDSVYAELCEPKEVDGDTLVVKGCIARLDLKIGTVAKLTNDKTIGNMVMSPNGKIILINYRSDGYWSAFDVDGCTEKRIDEINGYAHTDEIVFKGDYQVLTMGDTYMKGNTELTGTKVIDLQTGKRVASYKKCGDYGPEWIFRQKKGKLEICNVDGTMALSIDTEKDFQGYPQPLSHRGDYVLLGDLEEEDTPYCLCDLKKGTYIELDAFSGLGEEVEIYLAAKEGKLLLTDGKEAYLVAMK